MKCPKCGSEILNYYNDISCEWELPDSIICDKCGYKRYEVAVSKTELTTAEKLLWLAENKSFEVYRAECGIPLHWEVIIEIGRLLFSGNTLAEAIDKAYAWAKEQEVEK